MSATTTKTQKQQPTDSVIAEVRRVKTELAKRFNYDVSAMLRDARTRQSQSGHEVVDRSNVA